MLAYKKFLRIKRKITVIDKGSCIKQIDEFFQDNRFSFWKSAYFAAFGMNIVKVKDVRAQKRA